MRTKNKKIEKMKTINIKPSWREAMSIYIYVLDRGSAEGKKNAIKELYKIADYLDELNKKNKKSIK